jgi:hypothetical protein
VFLKENTWCKYSGCIVSVNIFVGICTDYLGEDDVSCPQQRVWYFGKRATVRFFIIQPFVTVEFLTT